MGHKHTKEEILEGALQLAFDEGLSKLTFGVVARHLGINDRVVVYYFPTKEDLIGEVLLAVGGRLQHTLAPAFGAPAADHVELLRRAWPVLATAEADPVFALFFEAAGQAAVGREPYRSLLAQLIEVWIVWLTGFLTGPASRRRAEAEAAVAVVDGLLLLRAVVGPEAADRAARRIGLR